MAIDSLDLNRQVLRLSGLSSGIDTESVVTSLLSIEQTKIDKQFQLQTKLEWKRDAMRDINLKIKNFRESFMSVLNSGSNMLSSSVYNIKNVTMLDSTSAVSVSADSSAEPGRMTINSITQLAEAAEVSSSNAVTVETMSMDTALKDLELTNSFVFDSGEISFSINGETFTFDETTSIGDLINTVNANTNAGVRMSYSSLTKGFKVASKSTGSESTVDIANITGNAFSAVGSAFGIAVGTVNGQDAVLSIEGINVERSVNTFTIDGITYSLKNESAEPVSFSIDRDIEETIDKIKEFIDGYNELVGTLQSKIEEDVYRSYPPLTDEQRDSLSESDAEKWDEKAKSGLLRNNAYISSLLNGMRSAFYTNVEGVGKSPADIGLRTGSYYNFGKITIDEAALRDALENNPDEVTNLLTNTSDSTDSTEKYNQSGLIARLSNAMLEYTDLTVDGSIASIENQIRDSEDRMDVLKDRYMDKEDALWKRFTAMETALATLNSQSSWLASLFTSE